MSTPALQPSMVRAVTFSESDSDFESRWCATVELFSGGPVTFEAGSVKQLVNDPSNLRPFEERHDANEPRTTVSPGSSLSDRDVLDLIQFNSGPKGLDISVCEIWYADLGMSRIQELRNQFFDLNGYDPEWWSKPLGLYAKSIIANNANFAFAKLDGADLSFAKLNGVHFLRSSLRDVDLQSAQLHGAHIDGCDLRGARLSLAEGRNVFFVGSTKLAGATLYGAKLDGAQMRGMVLDEVSGFHEGTSLRRSRLWGASLKGCNLLLMKDGALDGAMILDAIFDQTRVRRGMFGEALGEELDAQASVAPVEKRQRHLHENLPPAEYFDRASEAYRILKVNFSQIGRSDDASWAHFKQRQMWRGYLRCKNSDAFSVPLIWQLALDWLALVTAGYGERPRRPVATAIVLIVVFGLYYYLIGFKTGDGFSIEGAFIYSAASFFSMSFGSSTINHWSTQVATVVEAGSGVLVLGLFLWTIANTAGRY